MFSCLFRILISRLFYKKNYPQFIHIHNMCSSNPKIGITKLCLWFLNHRSIILYFSSEKSNTFSIKFTFWFRKIMKDQYCRTHNCQTTTSESFRSDICQTCSGLQAWQMNDWKGLDVIISTHPLRYQTGRLNLNRTAKLLPTTIRSL